jgi:hypothetical protein
MRSDFEDLSGMIFGKLTVAWPAGRQQRATVWLCFCICGRTAKVRTAALNSGDTKACHTCYKITHGVYGTREHRIFASAKLLCTNPKHKAWMNYGGRGIKFLFTDFREFIQDIGPRPSLKHSVDRIDNDGNYEPGNVRWATSKEQAGNRVRKVCCPNCGTSFKPEIK